MQFLLISTFITILYYINGNKIPETPYKIYKTTCIYTIEILIN